MCLKILALIETEYARVHRPLGHTPLESVALVAMIKGLENGIVCQMAELQDDLLLKFKAEGVLAAHFKFASGNELDRMFIDIRPGFFEAARRHYAQ